MIKHKFDTTNEKEKAKLAKEIENTVRNEDKYISLKVEDGGIHTFELDKFNPLNLESGVVEMVSFGKDYKHSINRMHQEEMKDQANKKAEEDLKDARRLEWKHDDQNTINKIMQFRMQLQETLEHIEKQDAEIEKQIKQYDNLLKYKEYVASIVNDKDFKEYAKHELNNAKTQKERFDQQIKDAKNYKETLKKVLDKTNYKEVEDGKAEFEHFEAISLAYELINLMNSNK